MKKKSNTFKIPKEGDGATIQVGSDRYPYTIIGIYRNGRNIVLQMDKYTRTDNNGMSESQTYSFERDKDGEIQTATLRKDGSYRLMGSKIPVWIGSRYAYYDYSF